MDSEGKSMDKITKGTWLINSTKHLVEAKTSTLELNCFEATEQSGKAGILLGRLVADKQEIIDENAVKVFARQSGITVGEVTTYANYLKNLGQVDYSTDSFGRIKELEVYCLSMEDAISTTTDLFEKLKRDNREEANILSLQATYELPRTQQELMEEISCKGIEENVVNEIISLQQTFGLVKSDDVGDEVVYYNEYAFTGDAGKIQRAMKNMTKTDRESVDYVLNKVMDSQGFLEDSFGNEVDPSIIRMMEGVGLLDGVTVGSKFGQATFYTTPQLKGQGVGAFKLSSDVFHKAKVLLSCLRFGQLKSVYGRGKITTRDMMLNIINKLVRGEWVGPCTAIGQDYQLLEIDGVIVTNPRSDGMYYMKLRQTEVGTLVKQMIMYNKVVSDMDDNFLDVLQQQPSSYIIPEVRKKEIEAKSTRPVEIYREKMLISLRTGGRI